MLLGSPNVWWLCADKAILTVEYEAGPLALRVVDAYKLRAVPNVVSCKSGSKP